MADIIQVTAEKIRNLQVKGARNVAIAAVEALQAHAIHTKAQNRAQFLTELKEAQAIFAASRETEPLMRNALRGIINQAQNTPDQNIDTLTEGVNTNADKFLKDLDTSREQTAEIGANRIQNDTVVFTHCNSSTVTHLLAKAKEQGKNFQVICTETRPAFQGRITAKELVEQGIETTFIVDSAVRTFIGKADLVVVGADAITSEGDVVNKIGTGGIAVLAHEARKPFYVVSELLKFDPETLSGTYERIEQRNPNEIWSQAPAKLIVHNPAFDVTPNRYIHGLICEEGIIAPQTIVEVVRRKYPWVF
ncbi:S-methyl-5-thioribose-1-phosphate isomerase [Candidatus Bathycorpusculum sp.]|uniref:translation initiation factor eIF-2B n=1 Tax=Candidatus Bathycorpusculum sp. TaxID=2994959 RepID=UPI0028236B9F|nr:S-methyl-5-thioribose-1-phosphate isomerase [Candidatus Termitimicrobium sp.]MCL2432345.1 S-methyl-5-thioribose-1-phosphate isomerase [Candidatus Termitimicrobium sp.]